MFPFHDHFFLKKISATDAWIYTNNINLYFGVSGLGSLRVSAGVPGQLGILGQAESGWHNGAWIPGDLPFNNKYW